MVDAYRLYIVETLMRQGGTMALNNLWSCFISRFPQTQEFTRLVGKNSADFEAFLRRHPTLINVDNFVVSLVESSDRRTYPTQHSPFDTALYEMDAIKYFKSVLTKLRQPWVDLRVLSDYLNQAPATVRASIRSQNELYDFFCRNPNHFEVNGDLVSRREDFPYSAASPLASKHSNSFGSTRQLRRFRGDSRTQSMRLQNGSDTAALYKRMSFYADKFSELSSFDLGPSKRPVSMIERSNIASPVVNAYTGKKNNVVTLSINEFRAISWLRLRLLSRGADRSLPIHQLMQHLLDAPNVVYDSIGTTQVELIEFISKHPLLLQYDEVRCVVQMRPTDKIHLIIVENQSKEENNGVSLNGRKGSVFHVTKLWGIIDLGYHEHVFFDRSLFKHVTDLEKHFMLGDVLYFNAVLAPKDSRAKWRATYVWKENDRMAAKLASKLQMTGNGQTPGDHFLADGDTDSGLDNVAESLSQRNRSNVILTPAILKRDPETVELLRLEGVNLLECITAFATVRMAAPWEVSSIIARSSELFSDVGLASDRFGWQRSFRQRQESPPSSNSASSSSELNTMSGIPSIRQQAAREELDSQFRSALNFDAAPVTLKSLNQQRDGAASASRNSASASNRSTRRKHNSLLPVCMEQASQTVFTGDILKSESIYHGEENHKTLNVLN